MVMTRTSSLGRTAGWSLLLLTLAVSSACPRAVVQDAQRPDLAQKLSASLSPAEFSQLIQDLSEKGGNYHSDNFVSNETSYLHVLGTLREMDISGGAYLGVGPEQNFTYIAKLRPRIAFIVDIRRQAMIQHLLYKAVFHGAANRAEFLAGLLCRPLEGAAVPPEDAPIERLLDSFDRPPAPPDVFEANLARIRRIIQQEFRFPLSARDQEELKAISLTFRREGLEISYQTRLTDTGGLKGFPTLEDLILQPDLNGDLGSFLATEEDFLFVRDMQRRNLIIPLVGDFAGPRALAGIGLFLKRNGCRVRAFYTSNVEQFLFKKNVFGAFVGNVRKLPIDEDGVFIRAFSRNGQSRPAIVPGHLTATMLQKISMFLKDYDDGRYPGYDDLLAALTIAGKKYDRKFLFSAAVGTPDSGEPAAGIAVVETSLRGAKRRGNPTRRVIPSLSRDLIKLVRGNLRSFASLRTTRWVGSPRRFAPRDDTFFVILRMRENR